MATFTMSVTRPDLFRQVPSNGRSHWYPSVVKTENGVAMSGYFHVSRWEREQIAELKAAVRSENGKVIHGLRVCFSIATMILAGSLAAPVAAQSLAPSQPAARMLVNAPPGFDDSCRRYLWFCTYRSTGARPVGQADLLDLARKINSRVNFSVSQLSDPENYGVADYWTLPANGYGDCEDFVLQKYKLLLDAGADSRDLSIAVVLDRQGENHAVLVLRHGSGDLVLDSLSRRIRPWNQTGYTFLAMQSGDDKSRWEVVMNQPRDSNVLAQR